MLRKTFWCLAVKVSTLRSQACEVTEDHGAVLDALVLSPRQEMPTGLAFLFVVYGLKYNVGLGKTAQNFFLI
jgi:hypothetical protein